MYLICSVCSNLLSVVFVIIIVFGYAVCHVGSYFPSQGLNLCPLEWKCGTLTTGPPGHSLNMLKLGYFLIEC